MSYYFPGDAMLPFILNSIYFRLYQGECDFLTLTVLPRRYAAAAPAVAPTESARKPTGKPKR